MPLALQLGPADKAEALNPCPPLPVGAWCCCPWRIQMWDAGAVSQQVTVELLRVLPNGRGPFACVHQSPIRHTQDWQRRK